MPLLSQVSFVLIAYSEPWRADQLCQLVNELRPGMRVASFSDGRSARAACRRQVPSLLILDGELEGLDGIALLRELRQHPRAVGGRCAECRWLPICNGNTRTRAWAAGDLWAEDPGCYLSDEEIGLPLPVRIPSVEISAL